MACLLDLDGTEDPDFEYTAVAGSKVATKLSISEYPLLSNYAIIRVRFSDFYHLHVIAFFDLVLYQL